MANLEQSKPLVRQSEMLRTMSKVFLSLSDQVCISGARFVTTILFAGSNLAEQGYYAVSFGFLLVATCVLESFISAPFNLFFARGREFEQRMYRGSVMLLVTLLAIATSLTFAFVWFIFPLFNASPGEASPRVWEGLRGAFGGLAVAAPFIILREFARRVEIARLRVGYAFVIDAISAVLQILFVVALISQQATYASTVYLAIGLSSAIPALVWVALFYRGNVYRNQELISQAFRHWDVARWPLFAQVVGLLHLQGTIWVIGLLLGTQKAGLFANCNHVLLMINPLALGACSFVTPLAVRTFASSGVTAVRKMILGFMLAIGGAMGLLTIIISVNSDWMLQMFYKDPSYQGLGMLMALLGANLMLSVMHMINDQGVWAIEHPRWLLTSTLIAACSTLFLSVPLVSYWGVYGGAVGLLVGRFLGLSYQARHFFLSPEKVKS